MINFGILLALLAFFSWGFGDFYIQRTTRSVGIWKALFFIGIFGTIIFLPFVFRNFQIFFTLKNYWSLSALIIIAVGTAFVNLKAFKQGKMSIIAPILGLELPLTVVLGLVLLGERLSILELSLSILVFIGIVLATVEIEAFGRTYDYFLEKGVYWGFLSAVGLAFTNYFLAVVSQELTAPVTVWFTHSAVAIVSLIIIIKAGEFRTLLSSWQALRPVILLASFLDNMGWVTYASAAMFIPIAVVTTISEGYIALAAMLGVVFNRETLHRHQIVGVIISVAGILIMSYVNGL